jgi:NADH-quinone oxidoreductase subunit A
VIFDVETIFLFPWALFFFHARPVEGTNYALFAMASMFTFLGILIAGYVWLYRKGALEWV